MSTAGPEPASLLTLPSELRNAIYLLTFANNNDLTSPIPNAPTPSNNALTTAFIPTKFDTRPTHPSNNDNSSNNNTHPNRHHLALLTTCRQIHAEAHLLALSLTPFHLTGPTASPDLFAHQSRPLTPAQLGALRHLTLTARISHLRALNEAWAGQPFGHPSLRLDTLVLIPRRPDCSMSAYAEVADLSQSHNLAYILSETLKGLRNVGVVEVRNLGCFNEVVWRVVYRSLVYRMWRWGGGRCGVRFECSGEDGEGEGGAPWFRAVYLPEQRGPEQTGAGGVAVGVDGAREVGEEVMRLAGGEMPEPTTAGVGP
ncbi:hypothetical protein LTR36_007363 [Oleoguttula mirabilis]|uniref:Uncharacterized protein n=1 Tax=Oleoguttula mirabilis TaxID=1507867 RepID=A0AAV9JAM2_9PEZI|nr:hypothetical protein LTR36_007363 [Oleoguttula mirabilis]